MNDTATSPTAKRTPDAERDRSYNRVARRVARARNTAPKPVYAAAFTVKNAKGSRRYIGVDYMCFATTAHATSLYY